MRFRKYALLLLVVAVCLLLLTVQTRRVSGGGAADVLSLVTTPFQIVIVKLHRTGTLIWSEYVDWQSARRENVGLRADNERLRVHGVQVQETQLENQRLRRLLALQERLPLRTLPGEIIGREAGGWVRSVTVNRGIGDGVATQTPVIVPEGLVGRIVRVRPGNSVIQLLNDPASTVGAVVQRTRTVGLVEGDPAGTLRFKFMARDGASIAPGDLVVTSGGTVFPKGLPVGRVASIEDKGSALFHFAILVPSVDFARLEEVLLLTGPSTHDLAAVFGTDG